MDELFEGTGGKLAAQAYWNALSKLRAAWREIFEEDLPTHGNRAMDAFEQALALMKDRLAGDERKGRRLRDILDVEPGEDIAIVLLERADLDDRTPNAVKAAMLAQVRRLGAGRHELRAFLRPVLDELFPTSSNRRPRLGANRHWPRLLGYLRELEDETDWSPDGRALRLVNAGGAGRVAERPVDPFTLAIRIDPEHL